MKRTLLKVAVLCLLAMGLSWQTTFASIGYTSSFVNPTVNGAHFTVSIYILKTGTSALRMGDANFWFMYNAAALSNPVVLVNGEFDAASFNDYDAATLTSGTFLSQPYVSYNILYNGLGDAGQGQTPASSGNGTLVATIQWDITDPTASNTLAWQNGGYALTNDGGADITANGNWIPTVYTADLPVELVNFTGMAQGRTVNLSWATKTEINNSGFDVERQAVSTNPAVAATATWAKVGNVTGKGTTNTQQNYSFSDVVKEAGSYNYRLKQIDRSGNFTYSSEVAVKATLSPEDYKLSQNYPNPFNPSTKFDFAMKTSEHVAVKVYNSIGQEVVTLFDGVVPADQIQQVTFDGSRLASGIYFYILRSADRVEVKKMLLMK